jgi:hypothetical protein
MSLIKRVLSLAISEGKEIQRLSKKHKKQNKKQL